MSDQQPIRRVVGQRQTAPAGVPSAEARAAMAAMANYRTRAPKGIFFYGSHAEMEADRTRWTVQAMVEKALSKSALCDRRWRPATWDDLKALVHRLGALRKNAAD